MWTGFQKATTCIEGIRQCQAFILAASIYKSCVWESSVLCTDFARRWNWSNEWGRKGLMLLISMCVNRSSFACDPSLRIKSATDDRSLEIRKSQMSWKAVRKLSVYTFFVVSVVYYFPKNTNATLLHSNKNHKLTLRRVLTCCVLGMPSGSADSSNWATII